MHRHHTDAEMRSVLAAYLERLPNEVTGVRAVPGMPGGRGRASIPARSGRATAS
jgi:hypothetical protein